MGYNESRLGTAALCRADRPGGSAEFQAMDLQHGPDADGPDGDKGSIESRKDQKSDVVPCGGNRGRGPQGEVQYALKNAFGGALAPMMQCLLGSNKLTAGELEELEKLIRAKRKESKS